ncbi:retron St85 family effector protein [Mesorhizobium sp. MSK_1335]|uniref:Retron St85 family effector protein n=1 Tax=Mesorhizobium montanum TaxID=3072323 RepID=A0ABU4ZKF0_9HYPH|nr:retron St85 family effector protein [Mesorhizobium sp. MSK_1335]MDX8524829.1 retron St85 family effector protein [Mesorhizobium sp. MSK_1335]
MNTIHVQAPSKIIFLCGGPTDVAAIKPISLREAFTRVYGKPGLKEFNTVRPEDFRIFPPHGQYRDWLSFESEFAEIVDLIILFSESYGSAAELGAFSKVDEIAVRLLVVLDDANYNADSFIKHGPVLFLENTYGPGAVCVLDRKDIKIESIRNVTDVDLDTFAERLIPAIQKRKTDYRERTTLNPTRPGHIIKFIVGLIQHYGALKQEEIRSLLDSTPVKIAPEKLPDYILCALNAEWIVKDRRGDVVYYCARPHQKDALEYRIRKDVKFEDKERWYARIIEFWKSHDSERFSCIQNALKVAK